jgi:hypothetical protein
MILNSDRNSNKISFFPIFRKFVFSILFILLLLTTTFQTSFSDSTDQSTSLTIFTDEIVKIGQSITILGELKSHMGEPLPNQTIIIEIGVDGKNFDPTTSVKTNGIGSFLIHLTGFEFATNYFIRAVFLGTNDLKPSKSEVFPIIVEKEVSKPLSIPIFAHYHVWWSDSLWDDHLEKMTDSPLLGRYHSNNNELIKTHMDQAMAAGVRGWVISWHFNDFLNAGLEKVVDYAEERGFNIFIHHNNLKKTGERRTVESIIFDLNYIVEKYSEKKVFLLYEKPVVVLAQSYLYTNDEIAQIVDIFKDELIILGNEREAADYRARKSIFFGNYYYWPSYDPYSYTSASNKLMELDSAIHEVEGALWWAPVAPGYHKFSTGRQISRRNGSTYINEFQNSLKSNPDAIVIISWNEWAESTYIEPSEKYGTFYLDLTRDFMSGRFGGSQGHPLSLNGVDEYYEANEDLNLSFQQFTIALWFRTQTIFNNDAILINKGGLGSEEFGENLNYGIYFTDSQKLKGEFETSNGTNIYITTPDTFNDGEWHYAIFTYNGSTLSLNVDGIKKKTIRTNLSPDISSDNPLRIGANSRGLDRFFQGLLSDIKVWNRSLSDLEILRAYNGMFENSGLVFEVDHKIDLTVSIQHLEEQYVSLITTDSVEGIEKVEISVDNEETFIDISSNYSNNQYYYSWGNDSEKEVRLRVTDGSRLKRSLNLLTLNQPSNQQTILSIVTVPALNNYPLLINNKTYFTDQTGTLNLPKLEEIIHVAAQDSYCVNEVERFVFHRWYPIMAQNFTLDLNKGGNYRFYLGLIQQCRMTISFSNPNSETIDSSLVDEVTLVSNNGELIESQFPFEIWLSKNYLIRPSKGFQIINAQFEVQSIMVDGSDISTNNQRKISPIPGETVNFECKVYPLSVTVSDMITRLIVKSGIKLVNINTNTTHLLDSGELQYDEKGRVIFNNLPAGTYLVSPYKFQGLGFPKTVIVNKSSKVVINTLHYNSLALILGVSIILVIILILWYKKRFPVSIHTHIKEL